MVVLGETGRNFGAGMSGGVAYIWDPHKQFPKQCNMESFVLETVTESEDALQLKSLITNHFNYTESPVAESFLNNWDAHLENFVKVMPTEYKRVLEERASADAA